MTYFIARRVIHRPKLTITVEPTLVLRPEDLDVHDSLELSVKGKKVQALCALSLEIACKGRKDVVVPDAGRGRAPGATPLPRVDFNGFRIVGIRTLNNDASRFYIPLGRHSGGRGVYLNIHRLRAGAVARFQIIGELETGRAQFDPEQCHVFPGAIPDVDLLTRGTVARPWLKE